MNDTPAPIVVGLGEVLWDCFPDARRPGGAPANVAVQALELGCAGVVCSRVGSDPAGDALLRELAARGLDPRYVQRDPERPTGSVTVTRTGSGEPIYRIHEDVAFDALEVEPAWIELMARAGAVCFGTLAQRRARSRATIHACLEAAPRALRAYDVNLRQSYYTPDCVRASLRAARIVKMNEHEARTLPALLEISPLAEEAFASVLLSEYGAEVVCVTCAADGARIYHPGGRIDAPGVPVKLEDPVGAGDAFTAAFVSARLAGQPLEVAGRFACEAGALVASRAGAMPELAEEYAAVKARLLNAPGA